MAAKKFVINILGSSCSGKSTVARLLAEKLPDIYLVSFDKQKWFLSGYNRDIHISLIKEILFGLFETVAKIGIPIHLEYFRTEEDYKKCKELAEKYGYKFFCVELTAPLEVLLERFHNRIADVEKNGGKVSVKTDEAFLENFNRGYFAPEGSQKFDTTITSAEEIVKYILNVVKKETAP